MRFGIKNNVTGEVVLTSWYAQDIESELERIRLRDGEGALEDYDYLDDVNATAKDLRELIMSLSPMESAALFRVGDRHPSVIFFREYDTYSAIMPCGVTIHFDGCIPDGMEDDTLLLTMKEMTIAEILEVWGLCTEPRIRR